MLYEAASHHILPLTTNKTTSPSGSRTIFDMTATNTFQLSLAREVFPGPWNRLGIPPGLGLWNQFVIPAGLGPWNQLPLFQRALARGINPLFHWPAYFTGLLSQFQLSI